MHVAEQGDGPLVLLCHGWPELWYSWRHQLRALAEAGFRAVAPDMRGFGQTTAPSDEAAYTIFHNVGDMVALVSALGATRAVIVGHDWGAPVAWHAALMRPDVFTAVVGMSVPHRRRGACAAARPAAPGRPCGLLLVLFPGAGRRGRVRARCGVHAAAPASHRIRRHAARREDEPLRGPSERLPRAGTRGAAAALADRNRHRGVRDRICAAPAFAAGSTGIATSTAIGS